MIKLITGAGGELSNFDKPKNELEEYANVHNFVFEFNKYDDNFKLNKLYQIKKAINQNYNYVIWVDYDIRILDYSINIMDYVNKNYNINLCSHKIESDKFLLRVRNNFKSFNVENTGVIVFKNNEKTKMFVDDWIKLTEKYYFDFDIVDNGSFLNLIGKYRLLNELYYNHKKAVPYNYDNDKYKFMFNIIPNNFNYVRYRNQYTDKSIPIIIEHFAGVKNREDYLK